MPFCRQLSKNLEKVGKTITGLEERAKIIDQKMADYEQIRANSETAASKLSSSSLTQFVIAGLVMLIAIGGAVINFNLIALPMSEMVGGGSYIGPYKTSNVAALVIILVELSMGLFLMESLRITRLFRLSPTWMIGCANACCGFPLPFYLSWPGLNQVSLLCAIALPRIWKLCARAWPAPRSWLLQVEV